MTQPAPSFSDHELVAAVRGGSDVAFAELYSRYQGRIGSYVLRSVRDHARTEDIVQDVFISALRRMRDTERPIAFKPWIYEIAKNACLDEYRRSGRIREVPLDAEPEPLAPLRAAATPEAAVERKQRLENLRGAFEGLSESHHRMLVMREFEGLSYQEIGERLGVSGAVVESTLFRARRRLSTEYEELVSGRRCDQVQTLIADGDRTLRALGLRERRRLARHLAHCQPCRRQARAARIDEKYFHAPSVTRRLAALLPLPWLRWRRGADRPAAAQQLAALTPLQPLVQLTDPSAVAVALGRAGAAVAAAVVIGGAGGGLVSGLQAGAGKSRASAPSVSRQAARPIVVPTAVDGAAASQPAPASAPSSVAGTPANAQTRQVLTALLAALNKGLPASDPAKHAITIAIRALTGGAAATSSTASSASGAAAGGSGSSLTTVPTVSAAAATQPITTLSQLGAPVRQAVRPLRSVVSHRAGGGSADSSASGADGSASGTGGSGDGSSAPDGAARSNGGSSRTSGSPAGGGGGGGSGAPGAGTAIHAHPQA